MYRQKQMPSERLLTMSTKCLFLLLSFSVCSSFFLVISLPHLFIPHISFILSPNISSGNLSTLHTASVINHLSPTRMYHSLWLLLNFSCGGGTQTIEPRVLNLHLLRGAHFVKCLLGAKMRPRCNGHFTWFSGNHFKLYIWLK